MPKRFLLTLFSTLILVLSGCAASVAQQPALTASPGTLVATFFDCGKADSTLIQAGGYTMLIDTATDKEGKNVVNRLKEMGVEQIDVLVVSHTHKDHVGGADRVLEAFPVKAVVQGPLMVDSKQVDQYMEALKAQNLSPYIMRAGSSFSLGDMQIEILAPLRDTYEDENDLSLVLRLTWGETVFLFPGDAEKQAINDLLTSGASLHADVLKVPHHGKGEDNSQLFFSAVHPSVAVIPCQRDTKDDLPESERVVTPLKALGTQVFVTHDGEVCVISDGHNITATQ